MDDKSQVAKCELLDSLSRMRAFLFVQIGFYFTFIIVERLIPSTARA